MKDKRLLLLLGLFFAVEMVLAISLSTQKVSAQAPAPTQPAQPRQQERPPLKVVTNNDVNRVAKKLYCPVSPNTPLDVCTTQACKDWRGQIREQLSSGWTDKQVMDYFVQQYGERVLAEPERGGFTSLVWMLPVLVVLIGLILVWLILKSWRSGQKVKPAIAQHSSPMPPTISQDVLTKIEAEIRQMD